MITLIFLPVWIGFVPDGTRGRGREHGRREPARKSRSIPRITLRNAQVRRISWVRGVRPARGRCEWPPHDTASGRPPSQLTVAAVFHRSGYRPARAGRAQGDRPDMSLVEPAAGIRFEDSPIVVVGAGAAGLCAAL